MLFFFHRRLWIATVAILSLVLFGLQCSKKVTDSSDTSSASSVNGRVALPAPSAVQRGDLTVQSIYQSVSISQNGHYKVEVASTESPQILIVTDKNDSLVLLGYAAASDTVSDINAASTALALVMMNPVLIGSSPSDKAQFVNKVRSNLMFPDLVDSISRCLVTDPYTYLNSVSQHAQIYALASQISFDVFDSYASRRMKAAYGGSESEVWAEDKDGVSGNVISLRNSFRIYYAVGIYDRNSNRSLVTVQRLKKRDALGWPFNLFPPSSTEYSSLPAGEYDFDFDDGRGSSISQIRNSGTSPEGMAAKFNILQGVLYVVGDLLNQGGVGNRGVDDVEDLYETLLEGYSLVVLWQAVEEGSTRGVIEQFSKIVWNGIERSSDVQKALFGKVISKAVLKKISGQLDKINLFLAAEKQIAFVYDLHASPKSIHASYSNHNNAFQVLATDSVAPAAIANLTPASPTANSITLAWKAPGDDGNVGTASQYDIRYSTSNITTSNWNSAIQCTGEPSPKLARSSETFTVAGLTADTKYYFAIMTADEVPNWSTMSNIPNATTTKENGSGSWSPVGSGMAGGTDPFVSALTVYNGNLIAGGYFTTAGGTSANRIASWNGTAWSPLGSGMNSDVRALTVYNGNLIAGGYFATAGGTSAMCIASWDGTAWSPLGSGMNVTVYALTVYNGNLIAGGYFTRAGGTSANKIASWDGTAWSPLGSGMNSDVRALTVYNGNLIAGGYFTWAGGTSAMCIASWDGTAWSPLGSGMAGGTNPFVSALTVYNGNLIVGGNFTTAGGTNANSIASWDGTAWSPLGSGMNHWVLALTVYNGNLVAGGYFAMAGGTSANVIASWDGTAWSPLGLGMNSWVYDLTVYNGNLIAGGYFTTAGGTSANRIAAWSK